MPKCPKCGTEMVPRLYRSSGKWGKAGDPKMVPVFQQMVDKADNWEEEMQLNRYRIMLEERGITIGRMQLQVTVRDGGLAIATSRGITRNTYRIPIRKLDNNQVNEYFNLKTIQLTSALLNGRYDTPCNDRECWEGARCKGYCDVSHFCPKGLLYQQEE